MAEATLFLLSLPGAREGSGGGGRSSAFVIGSKENGGSQPEGGEGKQVTRRSGDPFRASRHLEEGGRGAKGEAGYASEKVASD